MNIFAIQDEDIKPSERVLNAASFGRLDDLRKALDDGGDPDYVRLDIAPTLIAAMREYPDALQMLIEAGAHTDIPNRMGWTALHEASTKAEPDCLAIILKAPEAQVNVYVRDNERRTAVFAAMEADRFDNANMLLTAAPELIDMADKEGCTPAMWAVQNKKEEWLEWCLQKGADVKRENERGESVLSTLGDWDEGRRLVETTRAIVVEKPITAPTSVQQAPVEEISEHLVPANPFGLGGVKKKTLT